MLEVRGGGIEESSTDPYSMFLFAMRSPKTREKCTGRLRMFFDFIGVPTGSMAERSKAFCDKAKYDNGWAFSSIVQYLQTQKERVERKEISAGTMKNYFQAIKLFCDMADIPISWKKISRGIPRVRKFADDRAPTLEEIQKITEYPDRRIKTIVCTMASSGIRVGAWDFLKWKHIIPIERNGVSVAAKLIVYAGEDDEYFTFITPEALHELEKWKEYRIHSGEESLDKESWVMRNIWNTKKGWQNTMMVVPVHFSTEHKELLNHTKLLLEYGYLSINPSFTKITTALRTAVANEYSLNKEATSYDDCLDALGLSLRHYEFS